MRKPNIGKQRGISDAISSLSKRLPKLALPKSATPPVVHPRPKVNKPPSSEIKKK